MSRCRQRLALRRRGLDVSRLRFLSESGNVFADFPLLRLETVELADAIKAIANPRRLRILELLANPATFDGPLDASGRSQGVTGKGLVKYLRCRQPSLSVHMTVLIDAGLVESRKVGRFVVYTRNEVGNRELKQTILDHLSP